MTLLSVVIPTRNRAGLLRAALDSLAVQSLPHDKFEVIVVDNGSTDDTASAVEAYRPQLPNLSYVFEPTPGLHSGRHCGLRASQGEILVYADDDIYASPGWLASIREAFGDPRVLLVGGNNQPDFGAPPPGWLLRLWNTPHFGGRALPHLSILELPGQARPFSPYLVWGCNFSVRKSTLLSAGGFNPDGMPKDLLRFRGDGETHVSRYVQRTGGICLFHPGASVRHKVTPERMTFDYFRSRSFSQGVSDSFSALRRQHLEPPSKASALAMLSARLRRPIGRIVRTVRSALERDREMARLRRVMETGYREGYAFHQKAFAEDPDVRAWVLKSNYLED